MNFNRSGASALSRFAASSLPRILMVSHGIGGGVFQHVEELARHFESRARFLLLTPDERVGAVRLMSLCGSEEESFALVFDVPLGYEKLVLLLRSLGITRVHFHHRMGLPSRILSLPRDLDCEYDVTLHDYYLVNANATLTDGEARFVAQDNAEFERRCAENRRGGSEFDLAQWRKTQQDWLAGASRVLFPSEDTRRRFESFYNLDNDVVAPHLDAGISAVGAATHWDFPRNRPLRVLLLGALNPEKGADVLDRVAAAMRDESIEFHLLGYAHRKLDSSVICHGPYSREDVDSCVEAIAPDVAWFPARWPETYSYTLSIALRHRLAVVVPDIGAFPERIRGRAHSTIMPWDTSIDNWAAFWREVLAAGTLPEADADVDRPAVSGAPDFYARSYLQGDSCPPSAVSADLLHSLRGNFIRRSPWVTLRESLLKIFWWFSRQPYVAPLVSLVPLRMQRFIKRALSRRPIHEIVRK